MALHNLDFNTPIVDPKTGIVTPIFLEWLLINKRDKANRIEDGTLNNIMIQDANGNPKDGASSITNITESIDAPFAELENTKIVAYDSDTGILQEVDLVDWITGNAGRITVTNDGDGTVTLQVVLKADSGLTSDVAGIYPKLKANFGIDVDADGLKLKQDVNIVDASEAHTIADTAETVDRSDIEDKLNALGAKINAILDLLLATELMAAP